VKAVAVGAWVAINAAVSWGSDEDAQPLERAGDPEGLEVTVLTGKSRHELQQKRDRQPRRCEDCGRTFTSIPHFNKTVCRECRQVRGRAREQAKKERKRGRADRLAACAFWSCERELAGRDRYWCAEHRELARRLSPERRQELIATRRASPAG
jgi:hypothetical protein